MTFADGQQVMGDEEEQFDHVNEIGEVVLKSHQGDGGNPFSENDLRLGRVNS